MSLPRHASTALLVGDDTVNALGVARNLGREGIAVYRLGSTDSPVFRSRYIRSSCVSPTIDECSDPEYLSWIVRAVPDEDPAVIFPLTDLHVLRMVRNRANLDQRFLLPGFTSDAAEILVNKRRFYQSLAEFVIPHPATAYPIEACDYEAAAESIGYPVFLKPEISPLFSRRFNSKGFVAQNRFELARHRQLISASGLPVVMQEIIPGGAECLHGCAGYRTRDEILFFCYRRIREYPAGFGTSACQESVAPFVDETRLFEYLRNIDYTGIFEAEFKLDPRTGVMNMIEINARPWWQTVHPTISGLNIVKSAFDHACGRPIENRPYTVGTKWFHLYNDYFASREAGIGLFRWLLSLRGACAFDLWSADDKTPMINFVRALVRRKIAKTFGGSAAGASASAVNSSLQR
jgi:D-aspartate ligase